MDSESCELGNNSGKRSWSDSYNCCSFPTAKRFNKNAILWPEEDLKEEDHHGFGCISDLIQVAGDCDFSDGNLRSCDGSPPDSSQMGLDHLLTSLLTESEIPNSFSESERINRLNGDDSRKMGGSTSLYSGPTLMDVQSALSIYQRKEQSLSTTSISTSSTIFESLQSSESTPFLNSINDLFHTRVEYRAKSETKYSLKVKSCENKMDDGYKWRKYGQKVIKNSPYPRSYYRCTNPKCRAKKQVEKCVEDPHTLTVSYEGLHLHYSYSQLQITQQQPNYILHHNICGKEKTKKAAFSDNGYINGCFKIEGGDLMLSSESPTHQLLLEESDKCCTQPLPDDKCYKCHTILPAHQNFLGESDKCYESHTIQLPAHQILLEGSDKCYESLRFWGENSDIIDGEDGINVGVVEGGGKDGLLEDIVPLQVINPSFSSSSSSSQ